MRIATGQGVRGALDSGRTISADGNGTAFSLPRMRAGLPALRRHEHVGA